jgi:hypothetical protein
VAEAKELYTTYNLAILLLGDDNLGISEEGLWTKIDLVGLLRKLGLNLEPKIHVGPKAKYEASFCSSRFYPVTNSKGENVVVLGPPIGRVVSKGGWYVNPPPNMDVTRIVAGDARGRMMDCSGIPFLNVMWKRCIDLTSTIKPKDVYLTKEQRRTFLHNAHAEDTFYPNDETYIMIEQVYGLTRTHEKEYASLVSSVNKLPCIVDYPPLFAAATKDGVRADSYGDTTPPKEDLAPIPGTSVVTLPIWHADEISHNSSDEKYPIVEASCKTCMRPMCLGNEYTRKPGEPLFKCNDACAKVGVSLSPLGLDENLQPEESANEVVIDILSYLNDDKGVPFDHADIVYTSSSRA